MGRTLQNGAVREVREAGEVTAWYSFLETLADERDAVNRAGPARS
jgi:hypothetical protein